MVFVSTSLEEMCDIVDAPIIPSITHTIKPTGALDIFKYQNVYEATLAGNISPIETAKLSVEEDYTGSVRFSVMVGLLENAFFRGYGAKKRKKIQIDYYFGTKGLVFSVTDWGRGFNVKEKTEGFEFDDPTKGVHFEGEGWGFRTLMQSKYQARIQSSLRRPKGTHIDVLYMFSL